MSCRGGVRRVGVEYMMLAGILLLTGLNMHIPFPSNPNTKAIQGSPNVTGGVMQGIERLWDHYSHTMYFSFLAILPPNRVSCFFPC